MENFTKIECCNCGVLFAVSTTLDKNWHKTKATFYCPNGHPQSYTKSTEEYLKEQLEQKDRLISVKNADIFKLENDIKKCQRKKKK